MSGMHQALLMAGAATQATNYVNDVAFPSSNFTTTSSTYVDLLDATAGSPITVSITKGASSDLYVFGRASYIATTGDVVATLAVSDGTTDTELGRSVSTTIYNQIVGGGVILSGLGAGTHNLKLRIKRAANTFNFNNDRHSASITVSECGTGAENVKATNLEHNGGVGFSTSSTSYVDLKNANAGSNIAVTITKSAGTDIVIKGGTTCIAGATIDTLVLGVRDGTTDYDLGRNRVPTTANVTCVGEKVISGLGAGTYTFNLRVKTVSGNALQWTTASVSSHISAVEVASGAAQSNNVVFASNYNINSTSYTNLLDGSGGSAVSVSITKASAGTKLLVNLGASYSAPTTNLTPIFGVNDGTTDYDVTSTRVAGNGVHVAAEGQLLISGLAAGSYTITERIKTSASGNLTFSTNNSTYLTVREVN